MAPAAFLMLGGREKQGKAFAPTTYTHRHHTRALDVRRGAIGVIHVICWVPSDGSGEGCSLGRQGGRSARRHQPNHSNPVHTQKARMQARLTASRWRPSRKATFPRSLKLSASARASGVAVDIAIDCESTQPVTRETTAGARIFKKKSIQITSPWETRQASNGAADTQCGGKVPSRLWLVIS